jgi:Gas vesicle protein
MSENSRSPETSRPYASTLDRPTYGPAPANLADILERVLDKGIIIAGDIKVNLLDIELLTIKIRLLIVSVDKAMEMGIDWWRNDPMLTTRESDLAEENRELKQRLEALESGESADTGSGS